MESKNSNSMTISYGGKCPKRQWKENSMQSSQLMKIYEGLLKDIYWGEKALVELIPKVIMKAATPELISSLTSHLAETKHKVNKVEDVFESMGKDAIPKKSEDLKNLFKKVGEIMETYDLDLKRDAVIILVLQKVEYYKIASYGALCSFAKTLDEVYAAALLQQLLDEEKLVDTRLSEVAQSVNLKIAIRDYSE